MDYYHPPKFNEQKFHCPYCRVYAKQYWSYLNFCNHIGGYIKELKSCQCEHCNNFSYWYKGIMIVPDASSAPPPHIDMPATVKEDYLEASSIVNKSARGAAALLRLAVQKLMSELGESGKNINKDIASLVQKGLPDEVQQALDIVRVIGNESVHPGELDLRDDTAIAIQLFELINFIIDDRITRKKKISSLYSLLPDRKRDEIEKRDNVQN